MNEAQALQKMVAPGTRRPTAYMQGICQIHVTRSCDKACFSCTQASNLGGKAEFISPEHFEQAVLSLQDYFGVIGVFGGNPCLAGGTRVFTTAGVFPIEDLEGKAFMVRNLRGEEKPATCWHAGRGRQLYRIRLRGGHEYFATADHEWPALELRYGSNHKNKRQPDYNPRKSAHLLGKVKTIDLRPGMRLPIVQSLSLGFGSDGSREDGFLAGWMLGDGWIGKKHTPKTYSLACRNQYVEFVREITTSRVRHSGMIANPADYAAGITNQLSATLRLLGCEATWRAVKRCYEITIATAGVDAWMDRFGLLSKADGAPSAIWTTASEAFRIGFLDGLFSADGNIEISKTGFARIRLTSAYKQLARDVADLLGFYGIKTSLATRRRRGRFPNGKDYGKIYTSYVVSIEGTSAVEHFTKLVRLSHNEKRQRLEATCGKHKGDVESDNIEIIEVVPTDRYEDVWDISVADDTHCFQLAQCVTGNCLSPHFERYCEILAKHIPFERRGLWCNHPRGKGAIMRKTFNPAHSNLNVHMDKDAYAEFRRDWPEARAFGLDKDSRHSPVYVAMKDVIADEAQRWSLISDCDINKFWSSMICVVRGELRGFFCEIAGAQAMLHQHEPDYPDTGIPIEPGWWRRPMADFAAQVRKHCHECGVPLRGHGELAQAPDATGVEQVSATHADVYKLKRPKRELQVVTDLVQLGSKLGRVTDYVNNANK